MDEEREVTRLLQGNHASEESKRQEPDWKAMFAVVSQQLEEAKEQLNRATKELHNQQLKKTKEQHNQQLKETKEQQNQQLKETKEENDKRIERRNRFTLKNMLESRAIPTMLQNLEIITHENKTRSANILIDNEFVNKAKLNEFTLNVNDDCGELITSTLYSYAYTHGNKGSLENLNEASVQIYTHSLIEDALHSLSCQKELKVFREMSIFSLRPDLLVVQSKTLGVALVVEVKSPGNAFTSKHVAGQAFDYLKGMQRLGHTTPFVVVTTYNQMVICRLNGEREKTNYDEIVTQSLASLQKNKGKNTQLNDCATSKQKMSQSPGVSLSENPQIQVFPKPNEDLKNERKQKVIGRARSTGASSNVVYSATFDPENMFKAMVFALNCGILSLNDVRSELRDKFPVQGTKLNVDLPLVQKSSFRWQQLENRLNFEIYSSNQSDAFFLIRPIGKGSHGEVFLSNDYEGHICALKFYFEPSDWTSFNPEERKKATKKSFKESQAIAKKEVDLWNLLHKSKLQGVEVKSEVLHQMVAVKMPYFAPLPKDYRLAPKILAQILNGLFEFASKQYYYREIRWQHVACYNACTTNIGEGSISIILLDLESLEKKPKQNKSKIVYEDLRQLIQCSGCCVADVSKIFNETVTEYKSLYTHCLD